MRRLKAFIHATLLVTTSTLLAFPQTNISQVINYQEQNAFKLPTTYDEILTFLEDLESGELEKKCSSADLESINQFIAHLAWEGALSYDSSLEEDMEELLEESHAFTTGNHNDYMIVPAMLNGYEHYDLIYCGWISKNWKKTKNFVKAHKKGLIIGTALVVAAVAVTVAIIATGGAGAIPLAQAGVAAGATVGASTKSEDSSSLPDSTPSLLQSVINEKLSSYKETIVREEFFQSSDLSWEETGRIIGSLLAHDTLNNLHHQFVDYPQTQKYVSTPVDLAHLEIDKRFASNYASFFPNSETDCHVLIYQMKGAKALELGYPLQASKDLTRAIELNPSDPTTYLKRSTSYFNMGQYDQAFEDFETYIKQTPQGPNAGSLSIAEFSVGFAKGIPKGIYESGEGILLFLTDFISYPIHTSTQIFEALTTLADLARSDEWGLIGEILAPEIYQLVTDWDTTPADEKGELAGYALGKYGTDLLAPGAVAKIASKGIKSVKELATVCKNLNIAKETLVLETAVGIGDIAKVAEVIKTTQLADELGFTAREMGQLHKAGKLEEMIASASKPLNPLQQKSHDLFANAQKYLKQYTGFMKEGEVRALIHETGIKTFPRPVGIPENYRIKLSKYGAGMKYVHPKHTHTSIRVMPGKPHSPLPYQQKPYVMQMKDGNLLDKFANPVLKGTPEEAHIPIDQFIYIAE